MRHLVACFAVIALAGCAGVGAPPPTAENPNAVKVTQQQGGKFIVLAGPKRRHAAPYLGVESTNFDLLRSFIDTRSGEVAHQLYVQESYGGAQRHWNAARLASGQSLRFIPINSAEITCDNGCAYAEEFAAALPDPLLRSNLEGLAVVFTARSGNEKTIAVPADLIAIQLAAVEGARGAEPAAAVTPPVPPR